MTDRAIRPGGLDRLTVLDLARLASRGDLAALHEQIRRTGGCAQPIHVRGWRKLIHAPTGVVWHEFSTQNQPGGRLKLACGNRRASRCPSCARTYAADTFHLVRAGLIGDESKGVPATVREHPRVFATLTAPSFGPVHNRPDTGTCRCGATHGEHDARLGTPLNVDRYDYAHAALWNNHAPDLWRRFTIYLRREVAARAGVPRSRLGEVARVSFGKVAEYQRRGAVHFHAVIRLDGPAGADTAPPAWATVQLLDDAIRAAARSAGIPVAAAGNQPARVLRWGTQVDVRPIGALASGELTEEAVAAYVAKYATKSTEATGALDRRIVERHELERMEVPEHTRRLIAACWDLDALYPDRRLAQWSHMLGFRGHFSSKSPRYSVTLGALRQVRADYRAAQAREDLRERLLAAGLPDLDDLPETETLVLAHWAFAGSGNTPGESLLAASIARDLEENRTTTREEMAQLLAQEEEASAWL
ncbi:replication initiator protein RepSA [Streptomyces sp. NPDC001380]|uniref:replication initiator protein RepSA n=1 Tax=Streptomyces sp. NPDC001380 TaxID=3364566 RepID=UPI00368633DB